MSDPYSNLAAQETSIQERIADAMEARCLEPAQVAIRKSYLSDLALPAGALAVELGSGTGHVTRDLIDVAGAERAIGLEPSPVMVERARRTFADETRLRFDTGDATQTGLDYKSVDLVLMHTLLCHVPGPKDVMVEAFRILKPGGIVAIFDGDYDTTTVATGYFDPLEPVVKYMIDANVHNLWVTRQLVPLAAEAGFAPGPVTPHGYLASGDATYFMTVIDPGLVKMQAEGLMTADGAAGLAAEARTRVVENRFFGFMSYLSMIATKPG